MDWLSRGEIVALGWTLLHFCWQGTVLALAYAGVNRMTSQAASAVRYAVALGALALMPLVVTATFAYEMRVVAPAELSGQMINAIAATEWKTMQEPIARELPAAVAPIVKERGAWAAERVEQALPWVDAVWIGGVLLLALRALGGWCQLESMRRRARRMVPPEVHRQFRHMCERMRMGRRLTLRISDEVISPLAMGVWRATVILPVSAVLRMPPQELEAVLAHELGHIRRWDYLCNLLQTAVESVLFFHPAVWWLSRTVRERREVCCDAIAVEVCADPVVYAQALLHLEEEKTAQLSLAMALKGSDGLLLRRVTQVLGDATNMESRMTSGVRVAAAGVVVIGLLLGPRVRNAVAAPLVGISQPRLTHAVDDPPSAMRSQAPAAPEPVAPETESAKQDAVSAKKKDPPVLVEAQEPAPLVRVDPSPSADLAINTVIGSVVPSVVANVRVQTAQIAADAQAADGSSAAKGSGYLDGMRAAGYPLDLNTDLDRIIALKSLGVTPEYAKSMGEAGLGKPSVHELITLKSLGVTPEYVTQMKQSGLAPKDFHEVVTEKAVGVTPEYAVAMKQAGFGNLDVHELISLKAQGMTPEYAQWLKTQFPQATTGELRRAAIFHLDEKFLEQAKAHGFDGKNLDKLLRLKMSGLLDE
jgi:beta-lactamase regulating signal transducer with metallopeptidase domain